MTTWGTSPKFLAVLRQYGIPKGSTPGSLRHVHSAGAPLSGEIFDWFYSNFAKDVSLIKGSGGTDLVAGSKVTLCKTSLEHLLTMFIVVGGTSMHAIHSGEICGPSLGMKVEIWDNEGRNIEREGGKGDLVITKPFFSMPICFWGEGGTERYRKAYFEKFPGVWCHGDYIKRIVATGGYEILGRSDGVLNPGGTFLSNRSYTCVQVLKQCPGVRFGTAELYAVLDNFKEVQDCIAVAQKFLRSSDEQVLLFVKLFQGTLDDGLCSRIRAAIRSALSARHVPSHILQIADIPYTINGKKMEDLVRTIVNGQQLGEVRMAANPECLQEYSGFVHLRKDHQDAKL